MATSDNEFKSLDGTDTTFRTSGTRIAFGIEKPVVTVGLTSSPLDVLSVLNGVKDPRAGAIVFFAGIYPPTQCKS